MKTLALSPHSDDLELFLAYTMQREKPHAIICLESWLQFNRGEGITQEQRWQETLNAADILGYPVLNLGLRDDTVTEEALETALSKYVGVFDKVYAPALQGGNPHHDMVSRVAGKLFKNVIQYTTYTRQVLHTVGNLEVIPTREEMILKHRALECHESQMRINLPHFEAVFGKSEWLNDRSLPGALT